MPCVTASSTRAEQVDDFEVAPVAVDRLLRSVAASGAAAIVDVQHHVAIRREELAIEVERVLILAVRTAVDDEDQRIARAGLVARRLDEDGADLGAVRAR